MKDNELYEILGSDNFAERLRSLPYDEKLNLFFSMTEISYHIYRRAQKYNIHLFNGEESLRIVRDDDLLSNVFSSYWTRGMDSGIGFLDLSLLSDEDLIKLYMVCRVPGVLERVKDFGLLANYVDTLVMKNLFISALHFIPDDVLERFLTMPKLREFRFEIVRSFKSDKYKMRYLHYLDSYDSLSVIKTLSDKNKVLYLNLFLRYKEDLIVSISDDALKEKYLRKYWFFLKASDRAWIISSFKDMSYIVRSLKLIHSDEERTNFIKSRLSNVAANDDDRAILKDVLLSIQSEKHLASLISFYWVRMEGRGLDESLYIILGRISNQKYLKFVFSNCSNELFDKLFEYSLPKLEPATINKIIANRMEGLHDYKLLFYITDSNLLFKVLEHASFDIGYSDDMLPIFEKVAQKYNVNLSHLVELTKVTGLLILKQLGNENIVNTLNLDDEKFQKYLAIFGEDSYQFSRNSLSSILNSLLNRRFRIKCPEKVQIFINTLHAVDDGKIDVAIANIRTVISGIDLSKYDIDEQSLIDGVLNDDKEIVKLFNQITYEYLTNQRNDYVNKIMPDVLSQVLIPKYEINDYIKYVFRVFPEDMLYDMLYEKFYGSVGWEFTNYPVLLKKLIHFKKDPSSGISPDIKPYLKYFNQCLKSALDGDRVCGRRRLEGLKVEYSFPAFSRGSLVDVMRNIDVQKLDDTVFSSDDMYENLLEFLKRYALLGWSTVDSLGKIGVDADVEFSSSVVASLISNFELIMQKKADILKKHEGNGPHSERFTFTSALAYATCFDSDANIYSYLFGRENYLLLRMDPTPNASIKTKEYRLRKGLDCLKTMHSRKYITVPPIDKDYELSNGKTISVMIGNTNDAMNLTHGERTGACMRIGGFADSLFNFCLKNENGFHISFFEPGTRKYISRVSCYRNGNTLFLNQVRNSLNSDYSNVDLQEACKLLGAEIIELTKNSRYPIVNVVASADCAFYGSETVDINCSNPTRGFIPTIYTDIDEHAVVVAAATGKLSPIELGPSKAERYEVGRSHVCRYELAKAGAAVAHIEALDAFYSRVPIDEIEIEEKDVVYATVGEDWYVAITEDGTILKYVSRTSRNPKKANEEMQRYLKIMQDELQYANVESESKGKVL